MKYTIILKPKESVVFKRDDVRITKLAKRLTESTGEMWSYLYLEVPEDFSEKDFEILAEWLL